MGLIIFAGVMLGQWLDEKYKLEGSILTIIISLLAVFLALYNVIQQVNKLNNDK
jgi:membrane protein DedA with SNARE-associated domain